MCTAGGMLAMTHVGVLCAACCIAVVVLLLHALLCYVLSCSDPWDDEYGWELTTTTPCEQLVGQAPQRQAVYCSWFGITCCSPEAVAVGNCSTVNSVYSVHLVINNLNASVGDIKMVRPMQQLHDCGMRSLNLEANNLVGQFHPAWGGLKDLLVFNFGKCTTTTRLMQS